MESSDGRFSFASQLSCSSTCMNDAMISRSTSFGEPSAPRFATRRDDYRTEETGVDVPDFVHV